MMRIETVREQDAYDEGFANGKDYWVPLEQERILNLLKDRLASIQKEDDINVTAMREPVHKDCARLITEALIWAIENEGNEK